MIKLNLAPSVFVDVDETLILWERKDPNAYFKGIPVKIHYGHVRSMERHKARGHSVIVWSAGGADWAEEIVRFLELEHLVDYVSDKPTWMIDDNPNSVTKENYFYTEDTIKEPYATAVDEFKRESQEDFSLYSSSDAGTVRLHTVSAQNEFEINRTISTSESGSGSSESDPENDGGCECNE